MVFLTQESLNPFNLEEAKAEALRYSNLCRIQHELILKQEAQLKKMADPLGSDHQLV